MIIDIAFLLVCVFFFVLWTVTWVVNVTGRETPVHHDASKRTFRIRNGTLSILQVLFVFDAPLAFGANRVRGIHQ